MAKRREIGIYQVDAFSGRLFGGNPAAVCPLEDWLPDRTLQDIAAENNLSETAFLVGGGGEYEIRWFTPAVEVELCGHATLASAFAITTELEPGRSEIVFSSRSGRLAARRSGEEIELDFPARRSEPWDMPEEVAASLGRAAAPSESRRAGDDLIAIFERESEVRALAPDFRALAATGWSVIATAPGDEVHFVSRYFAPAKGIAEDPVTGAAHCAVTPIWAERLGRDALKARQLSTRGGELAVKARGDRVLLAGRAVLYLRGTILV